ncbi:MAG TPA: putative inorganic carbon transporter subunit DabA, partial [Myxococcota bacterium]|nr:putative inorganic carbon transporter subunit DabA [Myxococcota bacterium]
MLDLAQRPGPSEDSRTEREELLQAIEAAERAIPPLWTLRNFVAVNPFLGFTELSVREGLEEIGRIHHARGTMTVDFYRDCRESGRISEDDLMDAIREAPASLGRPDLAEIDPEVFRRALDEPAPPEGSKSRILTYAEALDHADGSAWATVVVEQISTWCAARFDVGQSSWRQPWLELPVHAAWLAHARWDHAPELLGLDGFREYVRELPDDAEETIARVLDQLAVPRRDRAALLARELASIGGWAGHVQYRIREARFRGEVPSHSLKELLAVRLAWDGALHRHAARRRHPSSWPAVCSQAHGPGSSAFEAADREPSSLLLSDLEARLVWQDAYESAFRRQLLATISEPHSQEADADPSPAVQAAFC